MFGITGENHPMFGRTGENHPMFGRTGENNPFYGKSHSTETKTKISATKGTAIYVYNFQGSQVYSFSSARKAAEFFDCSFPTILKYAQNGKIFQEKWFLSLILKE